VRSPRARRIATLVVRMAGCCISVRRSSPSGPSKQRRESGNPSVASAASKVERAASEASHSDLLGSLSREEKSEHRSLVLFRLDDGASAVASAIAAHAVGVLGFSACGADGSRRYAEGVVAATLVAPRLRGPAFGSDHRSVPPLCRSRSACSATKGESGRTSEQSHDSALRSAPQRGQRPRQSSRHTGCTGNASAITS
jgi:hypothetical protein